MLCMYIIVRHLKKVLIKSLTSFNDAIFEYVQYFRVYTVKLN